jgi:NADPH:quinone reductase
VTQTYRAAVCTALSGPSAVRVMDMPCHTLNAGQVRLAVRAAGVNFPDVLMTKGGYQLRLDPPFVPGMEVAGEIVELGADVNGWRCGDTVMAGTRGGGFATEAVVGTQALSLLPPALSFAEGAAYHAAAITALHALVDRGHIQNGESLLVLGASGGVGMAAVQLGAHLGALVIGTGSTPEKRTAILAAGAAHALDPAAPDLASQIKALTHGNGVDLVYDPVGGALAITATRAIAWGGRYLVVGFASGDIPAFPANHAMIKGYSIIGLRAGESGRRDPALGAQNRLKLRDYAAAGIMRPRIAHQYPLADAGLALRSLEERTVIGRAVITP